MTEEFWFEEIEAADAPEWNDWVLGASIGWWLTLNLAGGVIAGVAILT